MPSSAVTRRTLMASGATLAAAALVPLAARADEVVAPSGKVFAKYIPESSDYPYEITRSETEWRTMLDGDDEAYGILRRSNTEWPQTSDLWQTAHDGDYHCRGCDLPVFQGRWFEPLDKGWAFFHHAVENAVLLGVDGPVRQYGQTGMGSEDRIAMTEVHCRRCGSHLGHHLLVSGMYLHCINGASLLTA